MEPNYVRISEITGTRDNPVIKAVIQEEGKLGGHVLKDFTLPELNEFVRSSHILGSETGEVDHSGDPILTSVSHDEYLADVRAQVDHLFKNVTGSDTKASMGASGVLGRTLHIAKTPQRAVVPPPPAARPAAVMPPPAARPAAVVTLPSLATSSSMEASRSPTAEELKAAAEFFHVSAYYSSHIRVREAMIFGDITRNPNIGDIQRYVESHPVTSLTRDLRKFLEEFKRVHPTVPASQAQQAPRVSPDSVRVAPQRAVVPPPPAPRPAAVMPPPAARPAAVVTLPSLATSSSMEASRSPTAEELKAAAEFFHVSAYYSSHIRVREAMIFGDITRNPNIGDIQRYVESHPVTSLTRDLRKFLEEFKRVHPTVPASQAQQAPRVSPDSVRVAPQMGVRSDTISGTHLRERLLPAPEGPEGYYVVDLMHPRRPPPSGLDTMAGGGYRHQGKEGDRLVDPQQVRKQYPIRVLPPPHAFWRPDALGITEHGKHVIQQQALRSCVPTTVAMLLLDKGKIPEYFEVASTNLSDDNGIFASLKEAGCEGIRCDLSGGNFLKRAEQAIRLHGPIMLSIGHPILGSHEIILDAVDLSHNEVTIRDPYYGAMLTIPAEVFFSWDPGKGIQIL